jgi:M6 family metalloprotease-like protein
MRFRFFALLGIFLLAASPSAWAGPPGELAGGLAPVDPHAPVSDYFGIPHAFETYRPLGMAPATKVWGKPWRILVLLVDFEDQPRHGSAAYFEDMFFGRHDGEHAGRPYPHETMSELYSRMSGERLTFDGHKVIDWMRAPQPYTYYTSYAVVDGVESDRGCYGLGYETRGFESGSWQLVKWALEKAVLVHGVDLLEYDNDEDGFPEGIFVVHAGTGAEQTGQLEDRNCDPELGRGGDIWSHQHRNIFGGVVLSYVVGPERSIHSKNGLVGMGVWAHEFGHILGLPDLYASIKGDGYGLGCWDLMSYAIGSCVRPYAGDDPGQDPNELGVWSRSVMGWAEPKAVTANVCNRQVEPLVHGGDTFRITPNPKQTYDYFLVDYRARAGLDKDLPAARVCIWHIDERRTGGMLPNVKACTRDGGDAAACASVHYAVSLVQPDGEYSLERGTSYIDAGDCLGPDSEISSDFNTDLYPWSGELPRHWTVRTGMLGARAELSILVDTAMTDTAMPAYATRPDDAIRGVLWRYQPRLKEAAGMPLWRLTQGPQGMLIDADTGLVTWRVPADYAAKNVSVGIHVENCGGFAEQTFQLSVVDPRSDSFWGCASAAPGGSDGWVAALAILLLILRRRFLDARSARDAVRAARPRQKGRLA